jgi:hypothetical protein
VLGIFQTRQVQPSLIVHLLERIRDVQAAQIQNTTNRIRHTFSRAVLIPHRNVSLKESTQGNKKHPNTTVYCPNVVLQHSKNHEQNVTDKLPVL